MEEAAETYTCRGLICGKVCTSLASKEVLAGSGKHIPVCLGKSSPGSFHMKERRGQSHRIPASHLSTRLRLPSLHANRPKNDPPCTSDLGLTTAPLCRPMRPIGKSLVPLTNKLLEELRTSHQNPIDGDSDHSQVLNRRSVGSELGHLTSVLEHVDCSMYILSS